MLTENKFQPSKEIKFKRFKIVVLTIMSPTLVGERQQAKQESPRRGVHEEGYLWVSAYCFPARFSPLPPFLHVLSGALRREPEVCVNNLMLQPRQGEQSPDGDLHCLQQEKNPNCLRYCFRHFYLELRTTPSLLRSLCHYIIYGGLELEDLQLQVYSCHDT